MKKWFFFLRFYHIFFHFQHNKTNEEKNIICFPSIWTNSIETNEAGSHTETHTHTNKKKSVNEQEKLIPKIYKIDNKYALLVGI